MINFERSLLESGGIMMIPLLLLGIIGIVIIFERTLYLHRGGIRVKPFLEGLRNLLAKRRLVEALTLCEENNGPVVNILKTALLHHDKGESAIVAEVQKAALIELPLMERGINYLAIIAKISPFIGFLWTALSVVQAFRKMEELGVYANSAAFSGFISQALITSIIGILIGLTANLFYNFLVGRVRGIAQDMEWAAHNLIQFLLHDMPEDENKDSGEAK